MMKSCGTASDSEESCISLASTFMDSESDESDRTFTSSSAAAPETMHESQRPDAVDDVSSVKQGVRFSTITIREYPITLGDNPSVSCGAPVTIAWKHEREIICAVSEYEDGRIRRTKLEILLPASMRMDLIRESGASRAEIREMQREVTICRNRRRRTAVETKNHIQFQGALHSAWRATLNATIRQGKKKLERQYIAKALSI